MNRRRRDASQQASPPNVRTSMLPRSSTSIAAYGALLSVAAMLGGCGPTRVIAHADIPQPLIAQAPGPRLARAEGISSTFQRKRAK